MRKRIVESKVQEIKAFFLSGALPGGVRLVIFMMMTMMPGHQHQFAQHARPP